MPKKARLQGVELTAEDGSAGLFGLINPDYLAAMALPGTYAERARKLDVPVGTVRSRINRGRTELLRLREEASVEALRKTLGVVEEKYQPDPRGRVRGGDPSRHETPLGQEDILTGGARTRAVEL